MQLTICGGRGSYPTAGTEFQQFGCSTSCYALVSGSYGLVMDCGTGAVHLPQVLAGCSRIDVVFTHYHLDHLMGIVSCLCSVGPQICLRLIETQADGILEHAIGALLQPPYWPNTEKPRYSMLRVLPGEETLLDEREKITLSTFPANHPNGGSLLRINGPDSSVCLLCDHEQPEHDERLTAFTRCSKWIIFDGMYTPEEYPAHRGWGHSTWQDGVRTAKESGASRLIITHHAPWRTDTELLDLEQQARQEFSGCSFAREGEEYEL